MNTRFVAELWHALGVVLGIVLASTTAFAQSAPGNWAGLSREPGISSLASTTATAVAAGGLHTCALMTDGGVSCWGYNALGQLGNGTTTNSAYPVDVTGLTSGVTAIAVGGSHTCALTSTGGVLCWGANTLGQLGNGTTTNSATPVNVTGLTSGVSALAAGSSHTCAITSSGGVSCWGLNSSGQLGAGTTTNSATPVAVTGLTSGVTAITAGGSHACAVTSSGGAQCWGDNYLGDLGDGTTTSRTSPVGVSGLAAGVMVVAAGGFHTCAVTTSGSAKCWGSNLGGQLGIGTITQVFTPYPTPNDVVGLTTPVVTVRAGESHTCTLTSNGGLKCWGYNNTGQLGNGTTADTGTPGDVTGLTSGVAAVAAGSNHTCALTTGGGVKCWGFNLFGQLGNGTNANSPTPVSVDFVRAAPQVTTHPANQTVDVDASASFSSAASGNPAPTVQWQVSLDGGSSWANATYPPYVNVTQTTLSIPSAPFLLNGARYRAEFTNSEGTATSNAASLAVRPLKATPARLRFGAASATPCGALTWVTPAQTVTVAVSGTTTGWTASADQTWVQITGGSGTGAGLFTVDLINPSSVLPCSGHVDATVTITPTTAGLASTTVPVTLSNESTGTPPIGQVDTPAQSATDVQGAIGVTGWALDDVGVSSVKIYRNCLAFENQSNCQTIGGTSVGYIGDAAFVAGARPDVETAFSSYPQAYRGGWGYLMLTNMLPDVTNSLAYGGQGSLTIYAFAADAEGNQTLLGRAQTDHTPTEITMDNASIAKPFGAIDTPGQGQTVSGPLANFGWALTPDSDTIAGNGDIEIPTNGSTMVVFIDGVATAQVTYNQCRGNVGNPVPAGVYCDDDVANIFGNQTPQPTLTTRMSNPTVHRNLDVGRAAIGSYDIDTTALANGLHSIAWSVTDSASRVEGIGSRNFIVLNGSSDPGAVTAAIDEPARIVGRAADVSWRPVGGATVWGRAGFDLRATWQTVEPDSLGTRHVQIAELGRLELDLGAGVTTGYLSANGALRPLPAGSQVTGGRFTWAPAAGYFGRYALVFLDGIEQLPVTVTVRAASERSRVDAHIDTPADGGTVSGPFTVAGGRRTRRRGQGRALARCTSGRTGGIWLALRPHSWARPSWACGGRMSAWRWGRSSSGQDGSWRPPRCRRASTTSSRTSGAWGPGASKTPASPG